MSTISGLAFKDSTAENRAMWQAEMAQALQEIQKAYEEKMAAVHAGYDDRVSAMQTDIETRYRSQVICVDNPRSQWVDLMPVVSELRVQTLPYEMRGSFKFVYITITSMSE